MGSARVGRDGNSAAASGLKEIFQYFCVICASRFLEGFGWAQLQRWKVSIL